MLGQALYYDDVPFFWTKHFDLSIRYLGHVGTQRAIAIDGDPAARNATVTYSLEARIEAIATVGRDLESMQRKVWMEQRLSQRP